MLFQGHTGMASFDQPCCYKPVAVIESTIAVSRILKPRSSSVNEPTKLATQTMITQAWLGSPAHCLQIAFAFANW